MTAVVGILNKHAVAMAADSAVTVTGPKGNKISNKANKVFKLSKFHPIGIMVHNSASFMGVPWETVIKIYRRQLEMRCFDTVREYQEDFIKFLRKQNFFATDNLEKEAYKIFQNTILELIIHKALKNIHRKDLAQISAEHLLNLIENEVNEHIGQSEYLKDFCDDFREYNFDDFKTFSQEIFEQGMNAIKSNMKGLEIPESLQESLKRLLYVNIRSKSSYPTHTGIIFTGFGEKELFPSLIPVNISLSIGHRLRYFVDESEAASISSHTAGAICPFGQTDVIDTILDGVAPMLDLRYTKNFSKILKKYNSKILEQIDNSEYLLRAQIEAIDVDELVKDYQEINRNVRNDLYLKPLMDAVCDLDKEDLAEMAESMVFITYLKRRITSSEESVGGPIDVAIISKGDGFIWMKRKHYFKPTLNQFFFDNYYKI